MKTILTFLIIVFWSIQLSAQEINFEHIGANNGLSQISVLSIYQDELGYMWFGTREGLNRYDGQNIKLFQATETDKNGLPSNVINKICGDDNGTLYLLSGYKHLVAYNKKTDHFSLINNKCQAVSQGEQNLWYAVDNTIFQCDYISKTATKYYTLKRNYVVKNLFESSNGKLYIGTEQGLVMLDNNKIFNIIIPNNNISAIFEDSKKNIWVGTTDKGVFKINRNGLIDYFTASNKPSSLSSNIIRDFSEDNFGQIWIATFMGLDKIIPESGLIFNYKNYGNKPTDLSHTSIYSLFKDKQGTLWIGTYYGGINYYNPEANIYTYYYPNPNNNNISFPIVGKMTEDKSGNLWICTEGGGLNFYNRKTKTFRVFKAGTANSIAHNNLKSIHYNSSNEKLYIGTHLGGLSIYDIRTNKFKTISTLTDKNMPNNVVESIQQYKDKLLILTQKGIVQLDINTETVSPFFESDKIRNDIGFQNTTLWLDSKQNLWLAATDGGLKKYDNLKGNLKIYSHLFDKPGSIGRHTITRIYEDRRGRLLFSTVGSGLYQYKPENDSFIRYSSAENGLMSDFIYDITETTYGYLVLLTNKGVNLFDPETNKSIFLDKSKGLPLDMINLGCGICSTSNGEVFVGGINGMASFFENQIAPIPKDYNLFFSELYINDELITPTNSNNVLEFTLPYQQEIELTNNQNYFTIKFAASNYIKANKIVYEYKLEGLTDKWIQTSEQSIKYTNLSPGSYILHVRELQKNNPTATLKEIQLKISVLPPFYASIYAYLLYALIFAFALRKIITFNKSKILLSTSLEYEIRENDRIKELNQTKLQFFTNISHEFRTPLTLIIGQIESMAQMENITPVIHNKIVKIYKNASHLRNLITELLDFRKQERDLLALKVTNQDIVGFTRNIYLAFNEMAFTRKIDFNFSSVEKNIMVWFDAVQLQKVFYNLITNAFKYSGDNSHIQVKVERKSDGVQISIIDSGVGIPEEDLERIFERFYQSKNQEGVASNTFSTGVGLALSKGIVELHHGTIKATKNKNGGTTFSVMILYGNDHFSAEEKTPSKEMDVNNIIETEMPDKFFLETMAAEINSSEKPVSTILIVEDNEEMLHFLKDIFSSIYKVETAVDGVNALEKVKELQPDIVLSDVMMPNMSGKELCTKLKTNFETSHIPVVLLTADSSEEQNLESLMLGADDYITKPFNVKALISRCNNLVLSRKRMQEKFSKQTDNVQVSLATNKMDQELLNKATQIVTKYIDDSEFDVSIFASEMALGRSKLYLKIKGITGMTPNDFILNIRLKTAASMLTNETELNISDITYRLGFSTPRYFSKCFKELFGLSPLHYRKANNPAYSHKEIEEEDEADA